MKFQTVENTILIYGFDGGYHYDPYEADEDPIHVELEEFLATMHMDGFGNLLSKFIVELTSYSWVDRSKVDQIIDFMRNNYPESKINWGETLKYLEDYN